MTTPDMHYYQFASLVTGYNVPYEICYLLCIFHRYVKSDSKIALSSDIELFRTKTAVNPGRSVNVHKVLISKAWEL